MIFRALPDIAQLRPSKGVSTQSLVFERIFMVFSRLFCELKSYLFFKLPEMSQTTPLPFLLAREHLCAMLKTKNLQKIMIFRARTTDPGRRGERDQPTRTENPNLLTSHSAGSDRQKLGAHQKTPRISRV